MKKFLLSIFAAVSLANVAFSFVPFPYDDYVFTVPFSGHPWRRNVEIFKNTQNPSAMKMAEIVWCFEACKERMKSIECLNNQTYYIDEKSVLELGDLYTGTGVYYNNIHMSGTTYGENDLHSNLNVNESYGNIVIRPEISNILYFNGSRASGWLGYLADKTVRYDSNNDYIFIGTNVPSFYNDSRIIGVDFGEDYSIDAIMEDCINDNYKSFSYEFMNMVKNGRPPSVALRVFMLDIPTFCNRAFVKVYPRYTNTVDITQNHLHYNIYKTVGVKNVSSTPPTNPLITNYNFEKDSSLDVNDVSEYSTPYGRNEVGKLYGRVFNSSLKRRYFNLSLNSSMTPSFRAYTLAFSVVNGVYERESWNYDGLLVRLGGGPFVYKNGIDGTSENDKKLQPTINGIAVVKYSYNVTRMWTASVPSDYSQNTTIQQHDMPVDDKGTICVPISFEFSHSVNIPHTRTDSEGNQYTVNEVACYFTVGGLDFWEVYAKLLSVLNIDDIPPVFDLPVGLPEWEPKNEQSAFSNVWTDDSSISRTLDFEVGQFIIDTGKMSFNTEP